MSVRSQAKAAVKKAFAKTKSMWFPVTFRTVQKSDYNPMDPKPPSTLDQHCLALEESFSLKQIDGDKVQHGDRKIYIDHDNLSDPGFNADVIIENIRYTIVSYDPIQQDVLWLFHLRRAG